MVSLIPPLWLARKMAILGRKLSRDCRICPVLEFEFTCWGFRNTFRHAYGNVDPKPCPRLIVAFGNVGMRIFRELRLFDGLDDCCVCELRGFCLESCEGFKVMYDRAYGKKFK